MNVKLKKLFGSSYNQNQSQKGNINSLSVNSRSKSKTKFFLKKNNINKVTLNFTF